MLPPARPADGPPSLRERKKLRTRKTIQAEALRLFAEKGFDATTVEEISLAADVAPRTFFRYFATKEEVIFWAEYQPTLAGFVAARPDDEPAVEALHRGVVDGLAAFYHRDRELLLERVKLAFRSPGLRARLWQQQAGWAAAMARILAERLRVPSETLELRAVAAAVAAAVHVATDEWQAHDGEEDLRVLLDRTLGSVLPRPPQGFGGPEPLGGGARQDRDVRTDSSSATD